uniref:UDENN domain-containing protein n=1 Tax=Steinernema glaseri TaxID=37863 RepID=A0A1I8A1C0_9BILA
MHPILHVCVVGFHHKHGAQIDYCYPPLKGNGEDGVPEQWAGLPTLALPDGAHHVEEDVIFFLLPSLDDPNRSVFGISCYRQIASEDLISKATDVTRSSVQKSVVVLSTVPLFGVLRAKLELITQAYFNERDFTKVEVLSQMYSNLCDMFNYEQLDLASAYMDISVTELLKTFKHRTLLLFKLLMLEKKVVFSIFPARRLCEMMIGLCSLFPNLVEDGLFEAASYTAKPTVTPAPSEVSESQSLKGSAEVAEEALEKKEAGPSEASILGRLSDLVGGTKPRRQSELVCEAHEGLIAPAGINTDSYGFPLHLFTKGSLFHPYLDMIRADSTRAYCVGATNALFKQRRDQIDVLVTLDDAGEGQIDIINADLKRQLTLTTADLRFGDFLLKMLESRMDPASFDGGDDWIRMQFQAYLLSLLASVRGDMGNTLADFGEAFVDAWRTKHNFRIWSCADHPDIASAVPGHPFAGQLTINDAFLRVGHSIGGTEHGRKIASTITSTGKYVTDTGSKVKSSISSWFRAKNGNAEEENERRT